MELGHGKGTTDGRCDWIFAVMPGANGSKHLLYKERTKEIKITKCTKKQ